MAMRKKLRKSDVSFCLSRRHFSFSRFSFFVFSVCAFPFLHPPSFFCLHFPFWSVDSNLLLELSSSPFTEEIMEETKPQPAEEPVALPLQEPIGSEYTHVPHMISITNETPVQSQDSDPKRKAGRRKIPIEFIEDKSRRQITFSKRKAGLMKKAYELTTLTGTQALLLVASETGHVYTFATPKLQPFVTIPEGKSLIQACLNAPDPQGAPSQAGGPRAQRDEGGFEEATPFPNQQQQDPQQQQQQPHWGAPLS